MVKLLKPITNGWKLMYSQQSFMRDLHLCQDPLGSYYLNDKGELIRRIENGLFGSGPFDEEGIPLVDYGKGIGTQYNPVTVSQFALSHWGKWCEERREASLTAFRKSATWLVENQEEDGKWLYKFPNKYRGLSNPWFSSMGQGQAISVLCRAFQESDDRRYLEAAQRAYSVIVRPLAEGGGAAPMGENGFFYEEYPRQEKPFHVLNGHIFALFGLKDLHAVTRDPVVERAYDLGLQAVKDNLENFSAPNGWSYYQLEPKLYASLAYMEIHIDQLKVLSLMEGDEVLGQRASKWEEARFSLASYGKMVAKSYIESLRRKLRKGLRT